MTDILFQYRLEAVYILFAVFISTLASMFINQRDLVQTGSGT
jgi:hypothetical protein